MKRINYLSTAVLFIGLVVGYNNCSRSVSFKDSLDALKSTDIIVGNPMASKTLLQNICAVITSCNPEVAAAACEAGVSNTTGIDFQLGIAKGTVRFFSEIVRDESASLLRANPTAVSTCSTAIQNLSCNESSVKGAYNASANDPYAGVAFMLPTLPGSCPAVFNHPPARLEYFVSTSGSDLNDGSISKPWATITHAANSLTLGPEGAVVHVAAGNYYPQPTTSCVTAQGYPNSCVVRTTRSGTTTAPITFISDQMWGAKIHASTAYSTWYNSGDNVRIIGFEIIGDEDTNVGIQSDGSFVRIEGNRIHSIPVTSGCSRGVGGAAIMHSNPSSHDNDSVGNIVYNIGPLLANGLPSGSYCNHAHGIYHMHPRGNIHNNIVYRVGAWGVIGWLNSTNLNITNNLFFNNGNKDSAGNLVGGGVGVSASTIANDYTTVSNNIFRNNSGAGINDKYNSGTHNIFANNLFYANSLDTDLKADSSAVGSISADPRMLDFRIDGSGDYRLQAGSPAIDAGLIACAGAGGCTPEADAIGFARPQGTTIDIGPYEWHP